MNQEHLEKLILSGYKLIALETDSPEQTIEDFRPLVREGKAIYQWQETTGLSRMEISHIDIPNTKTPEMVINHINQSKLYGVYLLIGFSSHISKPNIQSMLEQITNDADSNKVIIFIDNQFNYPHQLMSKLLITQEPDVKARTSLDRIA